MAAQYQFAGYNIKILGDSAGFVKAIKGANRELSIFRRNLSRFQRTQAILRNILSPLRGFGAGLGLGLGGFFSVRGIARQIRNALDEAIRFENVLSQSISIVEGVTEEIRQRYRDTAEAVSATTRFSATESAQGFFFLASAGFTLEEQLRALPVAANFAQAGLLSLEESVSLLVDSQAALGLRTTDVEESFRGLLRVSDAITQANIQSNASIQELARGLQNKVAATATLIKRPLEEVLALLSVFAEQGIKGRVGGNRANILLRELASKAIINADEFKKLGISVFDAVGNFRAIDDVIEDLEKRIFLGRSTREARALFLQLGLTREATDSLFQVLARGSDRLRFFLKGQDDAAGKTAQVAKRNLLPLVREFGFLVNQFKRIQREARVFFDVLTRGVVVLKNITRGIADAAASSSTLDEFTKRISVTVLPSVNQILELVGAQVRVWLHSLLEFLNSAISRFFKRLSTNQDVPSLFRRLFLGISTEFDRSAQANINKRRAATSGSSRTRDRLRATQGDPLFTSLFGFLERGLSSVDETGSKDPKRFRDAIKRQREKVEGQIQSLLRKHGGSEANLRAQLSTLGVDVDTLLALGIIIPRGVSVPRTKPGTGLARTTGQKLLPPPGKSADLVIDLTKKTVTDNYRLFGKGLIRGFQGIAAFETGREVGGIINRATAINLARDLKKLQRLKGALAVTGGTEFGISKIIGEFFTPERVKEVTGNLIGAATRLLAGFRFFQKGMEDARRAGDSVKPSVGSIAGIFAGLVRGEKFIDRTKNKILGLVNAVRDFKFAAKKDVEEISFAKELKLLSLPPKELAKERAILDADKKLGELRAALFEGRIQATEFEAEAITIAKDLAEAVTSPFKEAQDIAGLTRGSVEAISAINQQGRESLLGVADDVKQLVRIQETQKGILEGIRADAKLPTGTPVTVRKYQGVGV